MEIAVANLDEYNLKICINKTNECKQMDNKTQRGLVKNLEDYVTGKTITQDQANKIKTVIYKDELAKKVNFEKTKTMIEQRRKIYTNSRSNYVIPLMTIVDNGTITQVQADEIIMKQMYLYHLRHMEDIKRTIQHINLR